MITVVTITFNNHEELLKTIESIPQGQIIEHLVINGGSSIETFNYLKGFKQKHISEKDEGISDAFNKGIRNSSGDSIVFINSGDVLISPDYLIKADEAFTNDPSLDYMYSSILFDHKNLGQFTYSPSLQHGDMPYPHPSLIIRRKVFDEIGLFSLDYKVAMDFDIAYRLKKMKKKGKYFELGPVVLMEGAGVSSNNGLLGLKERITILKSLGMLDLQAKRYLYTLMIKQFLKDKFLKRKFT